MHNIARNKAAIIGASGAIGCAFSRELIQQGFTHIDTFTRSEFCLQDYSSRLAGVISHNYTPITLNNYTLNITDEESIRQAVTKAHAIDAAPYDLIFVASGILHRKNIRPEKSLKSVSLTQLESVFSINTFGPILLAKHFLPKLQQSSPSVFAVLGARVGSISDNRLGGWYSYRASKAALHMLIKTVSIEWQRNNSNAIIISLHPGTVDSPLSFPFQARIPKHQLFPAEKSAAHLFNVIQHLKPADTGKILAWDGSEITP
ncbi:C-factor [Thalassocella blandensis]|nr:C-factor [Thalassocella blandensis]